MATPARLNCEDLRSVMLPEHLKLWLTQDEARPAAVKEASRTGTKELEICPTGIRTRLPWKSQYRSTYVPGYSVEIHTDLNDTKYPPGKETKSQNERKRYEKRRKGEVRGAMELTC
jgi:hypothetical protein